MGVLRAMTHPGPDTLVIVLGASGRVGQALLPRLSGASGDVVAVSRQNRSAAAAALWMHVDVTQADRWERSLNDLCTMARDRAQVIVVDLVLDKTSVATMRASLASATAYTLRLRVRLAAVNRPSSLVLASTTAVLAPWPYQTPYGLAKRRQLRRYAAEGMTGQVLLLPQLVSGNSEADDPPSAAVTWTFDNAAAQLQQSVSSVANPMSTGLRLVAPACDQVTGEEVVSARPAIGLRTLARVVTLHALMLTIRRDSPLAHRLASRGRLELTPQWLRRRIDHHLVPEYLVRRLYRTASLTR